MNFFKLALNLSFTIAMVAFCGCGGDSETSVDVVTYSEEAIEEISSSSVDVDTIEYVQPPKLSCKQTLALREVNDSGKQYWNYTYYVGYLAFWGDQILGVSDGNYDHFYYYDGNEENIWEERKDAFGDSSYVSTYGAFAQIDSILLIQARSSSYSSSKEYELCRSDDFGKNWSCNDIDTTDAQIVSDGTFFIFQQNKQYKYSADGLSWAEFALPDSIKGISNAFVKDDEHFIFTENGDLFWTKDFATWEMSHVPERSLSATKVVYGNGVFVYAGAWGEMFYSRDLVTWEQVKLGSEPWLEDIVFANGFFVAVGAAGSSSVSKAIFTSYNGKDFEKQGACGIASEFESLNYDGNGKFYAGQGTKYVILELAE